MANHLVINQPTISWPSGDTATIESFIEFCLYEDINQFFMKGYVLLHDVGELSRLIVGGEKITIRVDSPLEEGDVDMEFIIYGKDNEQIDERGVRFLKLMFTTPEALLARTKRICQRWNTNVPNIIRSVIDSIPLSEGKEINIDEGTVDYDYIAPNITCEEVIRHLLPLAYDDEGYPYVVFENTRGINIKSIKKLLDDYNPEATFTGSNILTKTQKRSMSAPVRALHLESCQIFRNNDLMNILGRSSLSSEAIAYDFYTRSMESHNFNIQDKNPYDGSASFNQFDSDFLTKHATEDRGESFIVPIGSDPFYKDYAQKRGFRQSVATLTAAVRVEFEQPHSILLHRVGECVNLSFDTQLDPTDPERRKTIRGQRMAGRYLITKVAHMFRLGQIDAGIEIVEAMKLGYGEAV